MKVNSLPLPTARQPGRPHAPHDDGYELGECLSRAEDMPRRNFFGWLFAADMTAYAEFMQLGWILLL